MPADTPDTQKSPEENKFHPEIQAVIDELLQTITQLEATGTPENIKTATRLRGILEFRRLLARRVQNTIDDSQSSVAPFTEQMIQSFAQQIRNARGSEI